MGIFKFSRYSSLATEFDSNQRMYVIHVNIDSTASCDDPDFTKHRGACKHIHAALHKISQLCRQIPDNPAVYLPSSEEEHILQARLT